MYVLKSGIGDLSDPLHTTKVHWLAAGNDSWPPLAVVPKDTSESWSLFLIKEAPVETKRAQSAVPLNPT